MQSGNNKIHVFPYPEDNLSNHPSIDYILKKYFPTLKSKVEGVLKQKAVKINGDFLNYQNLENDSLDDLEIAKIYLKLALDSLVEVLGDKKPIVFISDSCFTNDLFLRELKEVLGENFDKYVEKVNISYTDNSKNEHIGEKLYENSIVILGGSYSDLEDIPDDLFEGELANFIKKVHNNKINSKLIGVCWGQQLISSIIGFDEYFSERITSTYRGVAQFGTMPGKVLHNASQIPYIYRNTLNSITNNGKNSTINAILTRTGHVDFNLLDSYILSSKSTMTFVQDSITGSPIIWGTKNGNILGNQAHFEIDPNRDIDILGKEIYTTLTGNKPAVTAFANSWFRRVIIADELTDFVVDNGITGVVVDIEQFGTWTPAESDAYTSFLYELGTRLHANGKKLTVNIPAVSNDFEANWYYLKYRDFNTTGQYGIAGLVDEYIIMTYDYMFDYGNGEAIQPLSRVGRVIDYAKARLDNSKISIGINSYGYNGVIGEYSPNIMTYNQAKNMYNFHTAVRDNSSGEMYWNVGDNHYRYVDSFGMNIKKDYIYSKGINKVAIYHIGGNKWFWE